MIDLEHKLRLSPYRIVKRDIPRVHDVGARLSVLRDRAANKRRVGTHVQTLTAYLHRDPGGVR